MFVVVVFGDVTGVDLKNVQIKMLNGMIYTLTLEAVLNW